MKALPQHVLTPGLCHSFKTMSSAAQVDVPAPGPPPGLAPLPLRISTSVRVICAAVVVLGLCIAVALVRLSPPSTAQLQAVATTPLPTVQPRNLVQYSAPGFAHRYSYFSADVAPQTLFGEGAPAAHVEAPTTQAKTAAGVVMMGPLAGLVVPIGLALAWLVGRTAGLAGHEVTLSIRTLAALPPVPAPAAAPAPASASAPALAHALCPTPLPPHSPPILICQYRGGPWDLCPAGEHQFLLWPACQARAYRCQALPLGIRRQEAAAYLHMKLLDPASHIRSLSCPWLDPTDPGSRNGDGECGKGRGKKVFKLEGDEEPRPMGSDH